MGGLSPTHWLIVALIFVLLFGAKKLPEMARSLGQSARVFKSEIKGMQADDEARAQTSGQPPAEPQALPASQTSAPTSAQAQTHPEPQARPVEGSGGSDTAR
ncbi:MAG TPA: Sec-independent protein translocase subunit TatA [Pseudonocardia sp.]|jgi:sec-independent protein translocase protein TatA|nr:Sec-independent protein translocase subunit TatA [Pseudonocardia sp.]